MKKRKKTTTEIDIKEENELSSELLSLPKLTRDWSDQNSFVKGRYIGQNIRLINDIMEHTKLHNIPGILPLLDFRKAFDTKKQSKC